MITFLVLGEARFGNHFFKELLTNGASLQLLIT